jgi:hypothetical protein
LSDSSRSPRIIKGALVAIGSDSRELMSDENPMFVFQYNPERLTREISYSDREDSIAVSERPRHRPEGPVEIIRLTLELDAADQLEKPGQHPHTVENGLLPSLAVLESMMFPSGEFPVVVFMWGPKRTIPIRLTSYKITEEAFDQNLNPIRVKIDLCMQVLGSSDFKPGSVGHEIYKNYQTQKDALAIIYKRRHQ